MGVTFEIKGVKAAIDKAEALAANSRKGIQKALEDYADDVANLAKTLAPADEGRLRNSISAKYGNLEVSIVAATNYAAYLEFGTRKYAAEYLASLPSDWKTYAATFKGKRDGGGDMLESIMDWVKRKGIGAKGTDRQTAYMIMMHILRNGIRPQPFLYPAVTNKQLVDRLKEDLTQVLK